MAFSKKTGRKYQSRRDQGLRPTQHPDGYDRFGMPIICGLLDSEGSECQTLVSLYGLCDAHYEERMRSLGAWRDRPELFESRST